jgi:hypothetical protein
LSNGGWTWLKAIMLIEPSGSNTATFTPAELRSMGTRSISGFSSQSTSLRCRAAAAVELSGMIFHSTRSICTSLPPALALAGSWRGTYFSKRA